MPTFEWLPAFGRDLQRLTEAEREAFRAAVSQFVTDLSVGGPFTPDQCDRLEQMAAKALHATLHPEDRSNDDDEW